MRIRRIVMAALVFVSACVVLVADAAVGFPVRGSVTDPLGNPIAGAVVHNGVGRATVTSTDGRWELVEPPGTRTYWATKAGFNRSQERSVTVVDPRGTSDVDLVMTSILRTDVSPWSFNPSINRNMAITASSILTPEACVTWTDLSSGATVQLLPSTPEPPRSVWTGSFDIAPETDDGSFVAEVIARDCATGTVLTDTRRHYYSVDRVPPEILGSPYEDGVAGKGVVAFKVRDTTSGFNPSASSVSVDGGPWAAPTIWNPMLDLAQSSVPVSDGIHTVRVRAVDYAGNVSEGEFSFIGDVQEPSFAGNSPIGTTSPTPLVGVSISDIGAGLEVSSLRMRLTGGPSIRAPLVAVGPSSGYVDAVWDATTGRFEYQVPSEPTGTGMAEGPLLPGKYDVTVKAQDLAGNNSVFTWEFVVEPL